MDFDWDLAVACLPRLLQGLWITVLATLGGMGIALVLGLAFAALRRSGVRAVSAPIWMLVQAVRNTPLLLQLYLIFYLAPGIGISLSPLAAGILGLGLHYACYAAEIYRAGIEGVERGQLDAAIAIGLSPAQRFRLVVLPQALPPSIPALGNLLIAMFKDAPLLSAITVLGLLTQAKLIGSETFQYLEPMTMVGLIFLAVSLLAAIPVRLLERRLGRST